MNHPVYLAVDLGASSGRHIAGWREDGEIRTEEVYRFPKSDYTRALIRAVPRMPTPEELEERRRLRAERDA